MACEKNSQRNHIIADSWLWSDQLPFSPPRWAENLHSFSHAEPRLMTKCLRVCVGLCDVPDALGGQLTVPQRGWKQASSCSLSQSSVNHIIRLVREGSTSWRGPPCTSVHSSCERRRPLPELFVCLSFDPVCCFQFLRLVTTCSCSQRPLEAAPS